jgi:hypothetical protein
VFRLSRFIRVSRVIRLIHSSLASGEGVYVCVCVCVYVCVCVCMCVYVCECMCVFVHSSFAIGDGSSSSLSDLRELTLCITVTMCVVLLL